MDFVLVRALDGDLGIMPNHAPLIASLSIWPLCYDKGGKRQYVTVASGFLEVHDNTVTVITPASEKPEDIDVDRAKSAEKRAEDRLAAHAADIDTTRAEAPCKEPCAAWTSPKNTASNKVRFDVESLMFDEECFKFKSPHVKHHTSNLKGAVS